MNSLSGIHFVSWEWTHREQEIVGGREDMSVSSDRQCKTGGLKMGRQVRLPSSRYITTRLGGLFKFPSRKEQSRPWVA